MGIASKLGQGSGGGPTAAPNYSQAQTSFPPASQGAPGNPFGPSNPYGQPGASTQPTPGSNSMYPTIGAASQYPSMGAPQYPQFNFPGGAAPPTAAPSFNNYSPYGAPVQQNHGFQTPSGFSQQDIKQKLEKMVNENRLHHYYPPHRLDTLANEVSRLDVCGLGKRWNLPREVNLDLITLALYDIVIYADDSTSMQALDDGERIEDLKAILGRVAEAATMFDTDGISIRFMNSKKQFDNLRNASDVQNAIAKVTFEGYTPLGSMLEEKVLIPFVITPARNNFMKKPVLVITITDGEPTGPGEHRNTTREKIVRAHDYLRTLPYGTGAVSYMFAQVGKDETATRFLGELDVDPKVGSLIDCVSDYEIEEAEYSRKNIQLTPDVYMVKLMVGAIDRGYDEGDEG